MAEGHGRVLAVVVLYGRAATEAAAWPMLMATLGRGDDLQLAHCLLHDNSPHPSPAAARNDVSWRSVPANPGTAGAYTAAVKEAAQHGCDWLLLLDQDTALPMDYLARAGAARRACADAAVLIPRVRHAGALVSPAVIGPSGQVSPRAVPSAADGVVTAISSGLLVRREALAAALPLPPAIWLDYVDHCLFLAWQRQGRRFGLIDVDLAHDLSVRARGGPGLDRLRNLLVAERVFHSRLEARSSFGFALRRFARAARFAATGRLAHAAAVVRDTFAGSDPHRD